MTVGRRASARGSQPHHASVSRARPGKRFSSRRSRVLAADAPFPSPTPSSSLSNALIAQVDAAEHAYHRLNVALKREVESNEAGLSRWELQQIAKLTALLNLRVKELRTDRDMGIGPEACKELKGYFSTFLLDEKAEFPFDVAPEAVGDVPVSLQLEQLTVFGEHRGGSTAGRIRPRQRRPPRNRPRGPHHLRGWISVASRASVPPWG